MTSDGLTWNSCLNKYCWNKFPRFPQRNRLVHAFCLWSMSILCGSLLYPAFPMCDVELELWVCPEVWPIDHCGQWYKRKEPGRESRLSVLSAERVLFLAVLLVVRVLVPSFFDTFRLLRSEAFQRFRRSHLSQNLDYLVRSVLFDGLHDPGNLIL